MPNRSELPLIYSCSGCSDVAQLANDTAVALDHAGEFEMSCISGVGGKVAPLVHKAQSGRPMLVVDGCHLYELGYKKRFGKSYDEAAVNQVYQYILNKKDDVSGSLKTSKK